MKYERVTERAGNGKSITKGCATCNDICFDCSYAESAIERLAELEDKIEQGTLIELPCKVGDTVYVPWRWDDQQGVASVKVEEINFYDTQMHYMFLIDMESDDESFNQEFGGWKIDQSIGKTVFLTREEAEKRLEELQK